MPAADTTTVERRQPRRRASRWPRWKTTIAATPPTRPTSWYVKYGRVPAQGATITHAIDSTGNTTVTASSLVPSPPAPVSCRDNAHSKRIATTSTPPLHVSRYAPRAMPPAIARERRLERFGRAFAARTRNMNAVVLSSTSAQWWSVKPNVERCNNCPGMTAAINAAQRPAVRENSSRPRMYTGRMVKAPRTGGTYAPTTSTRRGDGVPSPSTSAEPAMIQSSTGPALTDSPPGCKR